MAIADLALAPGFALQAESTSNPDNGLNTFGIGIARVNVDVEDSLDILVLPQGPSVSSWAYIPGSLDLNFDPPRITMTITQLGGDLVRLIVRQRHTETR